MIQWESVKQRHQKGFTLLELLVVIAIVVVLAGLLFPAVQSVLERAKKVQAKNDLTQIVTAINAYYTEYGKYPIATSEKPLNSTETADLFNTLRAIGSNGGANAANAQNTRQIVFMTPPNAKDASNPRSGIGSDGEFYDPWGSTYQIAMDATYDTNIQNPYQPDTGAGPDEIRQGAITWSFGRDKKLGNAGDSKFTGSDDVISWQ